MTKNLVGRVCLPLLCGIIPMLVAGCGSSQNTTVAAITPTPIPKFTAAEQKFIQTAKGMTPQQQMEFFKKNPNMLKNRAVTDKIYREMPRPQFDPSQRGPKQRPRLPTGRPDFAPGR